jgi:thiol-disulfide isomerase/thioredoxin
MKHFLLTTLCLALTVSGLLAADKPAKLNAPTTPAKMEAVLKANPDDLDAHSKYLRACFDAFKANRDKNPAKAEKALDGMVAFLKSLEPTTDAAKLSVRRGVSISGSWLRSMKIAQTPIEDYIKRIKANPDDTTAISGYYTKSMSEISPLSRTNPDAAEEKMANTKAYLAKVKERSKKETTAQMIDRYARGFASVERRIAAGRKHANLIGADAAKLEVASWTNGQALTEKDLKGKVVLIDFWAIWCGPCIATFPHLRDWREKYSDKGLVIIGLTRKYNYKWNADTGRASKIKDENTTEQEHEMLAHFAKHHKLKHVFGIQKDRAISDYYGVTGIPQVVVIDRKGKVRLIRVGSGEKNAHDVEAMLEKLIGAKTAARE